MEKIINKLFSLIVVVPMLMTTNTVGAAEVGQQIQENQYIEEFQDILYEQAPPMLSPPEIKSESVSNSIYDSSWQQRLQNLNLISEISRKKRLHKQNRFVYTKRDLEQLILGGATEEDIYFSDFLGNEWLTNPRELIEQKKESKKSWDEVEVDLSAEKQKTLKDLIQLNPSAEGKLNSRIMNTAEKIEILESVSSSDEGALERAINNYEKNEFYESSEFSTRSIEKPVVEQSVLNAVYSSDNVLQQLSEMNQQSLTQSNYAAYSQDVNGIYNGLITQMQINQTNKPQYSDWNGTSEIIDPSSGKLVWNENQISLPGRDGLDLNIGVSYQSNYAYTYQKTYGINGNLKKANYLLSRYDLGAGWGFQFPSIQLAEGGYLYYHKGDGAVYRIDFYANTNPDNFTHLIGYQGKDMKLLRDTQGSFNNGQASSSYYLEYADKKREYFAVDGRLIGIVDRFGNKITFQHTDRKINDNQTYKVISSITDSIGRIVMFTYDSTLQNEPFTGEGIVVSVKDLNGNVTHSVSFMKWRSDDTFNGNPDGHSPFLWYIMHQDGDYTYFTHEYFQDNKFDYYNAVNSSNAGWTSLHPLKLIENPQSFTNFQYEKVTRRLGSSGFAEDYRITSRNNQVKKNYVASGDYNQINHSYTGDYTGYNPSNPYSNPSSFAYATTQTIKSTSLTGEMVTTTNYNDKGQITSISTRASNGERRVLSNASFDPVYTTMPTATEIREYNGDTDTSPNILYSSKQYTDWGGVQSETVPLMLMQYQDATTKSKYTTSYTYDPTYYFIKTRNGYQNQNTLLTEQYDYYSNGRIKSYSNPKGEVTNYCYEALEANGSMLTNCTDPTINIGGTLTKIKTIRSIGNSQTAINETIYTAAAAFAYPSETRSYFTTKNASGQNVTQTVQKTMIYDMGSGRLESETSGGQVTSYQYDEHGRPTKIIYPRFVNANGTSYDVVDEIAYLNTIIPSTADTENASVSSLLVVSKRKYTELPSNTATVLSLQYDYYDGLGFLRYSQQSNNGVIQTTQYRSDDMARAIYAIDPMNNTTTVAYDAWGGQKEAQDTYGNLYVFENNMKSHMGIHYFVAAVDVPAYRGNQTLDNLKSSYIEQDYDNWGQLLANRVYKDWPNTEIPLTELFIYDIAGNQVAYTDPKGNKNNEGVTMKYTYDALNRLITVKDAIGQLTKYSYNGNGQITEMTVQGDEISTPQVISAKTYNEIGGLDSKTDPAYKSESYVYNNKGLLDKSTDRNGTVFMFQYDEQNRAILRNATGSGSTIQQQKLIVGSNGILADTQEKYKNDVKSSSLTVYMDYLKRVTGIQVQGADSSYLSSLGISYDLNNRITQYKIAGGSSVNFYTHYKYDRLRLDKVQINGQLAINNADTNNVIYTYYPNGQVQYLSYPPLEDGSILKSEYVYDKLNRIQLVTNKKGTTLLSSYGYTYDDNGNIETISQTKINQSTKTNLYSYDKLNRLNSISRADGTTATYVYDLRGNRLTLSDTKPNTYEDISYQYDLYNTLTSAVKGGLTTSFEYSPDGLRYRKENGTNIKQYRYNANKEVISEVDGSNQVTANYVRGDRLLVKKDVASNKDYYYLYNGHGDVIQMVDTNGDIINSYEYDEWGNITQQTEQVDNAFKYTGEIYDEETGFYYLRARYYDPSLGRFINEDAYEGTLTNPLTQNLYTYVHNNPLIYSDPTGNWCTATVNGKIYSHAGGCDGGVSGVNVKKDVGSSKWTPDYLHVGSKEIFAGKPIGAYMTTAELDMSEAPQKKSTSVSVPAAATIAIGAPSYSSPAAAIGSGEILVTLIRTSPFGLLLFMSGDSNQEVDEFYYYQSRAKQKAGDVIAKEKKGSINGEFPNEWRDRTLGEIDKAAKQGNSSAKKAKKLLNDKRFDKGDNRK